MAPFFDSRCIYNLPHHDAFFHVLHFQRRHWWVIGPQSCGQSEKPTHIQPRRRYMAVASDIDVLVGEKRAYYYYYYYYYGIVAGTVVLMCGNWKSISTHSCYLKIAIKHATASYREDNVTSTPTFYTSLTNIDVSDGWSDVAVICGHNTISVLWGQHGVLYEVEWWRVVTLFE